jgi:hypothetical protein
VNILDYLLRQEASATRQLLLDCQELTGEQLATPLGDGLGSLHETLVRLVQTVELWLDLLHKQPVRLLPEPKEIADSIKGLITRLDAIAADTWGEASPPPVLKEHNPVEAEEAPLVGVITPVLSRNQQRRAVVQNLLSQLIRSEGLEETRLNNAAILLR